MRINILIAIEICKSHIKKLLEFSTSTTSLATKTYCLQYIHIIIITCYIFTLQLYNLKSQNSNNDYQNGEESETTPTEVHLGTSVEMPKIELNEITEPKAVAVKKKKFKTKPKKNTQSKRITPKPKNKNNTELGVATNQENFSKNLLENYKQINDKNFHTFEFNKKLSQFVAEEKANLNVANFGGGSFSSVVSNRGLANTPIFSNPSVIYYANGVPLGEVFTYDNLSNAFGKIKFHRRPMGHYFGKNSYGGVIEVDSDFNLTQNKAEVEIAGGSYNFLSTKFKIFSPICSNKLFLEFALNHSTRDGFLHNPILSIRPDDEKIASGELRLIWDMLGDDNTSSQNTFLDSDKKNKHYRVTFGLDYFNQDSGSAFLQSLDSENYVLNSDRRGNFNQSRNAQTFDIDYKNEKYSLRSTTSRQEWRLDPFDFDLDLSPAEVAFSRQTQEQKYFTQEIKFSVWQNPRVQWFGGMFGSYSKIKSRNVRNFLSSLEDSNYTLRDKELAFYLRNEVQITSKLKFKLGARISHFDKKIDRKKTFGTVASEFSNSATPNPTSAQSSDIDAINFNLKENYSFLSPLIELEYDFWQNNQRYPRDKLKAFASFQRTFKPGGFSAYTDEVSLAEFGSENANALEAGLRFRKENFSAKLTGFYYDIEDYQVERSFSPTDYIISNAERAESYGLELSTGFDLGKYIRLYGEVGLTKTRFLEYHERISGLSLAGNKFPFVPKFDYALNLEINGGGQGPFARVSYRGFKNVYFDDSNSHDFKENGGGNLSAELGWRGKNVEFAIYGKNITGEYFYNYILPDIRGGSPTEPQQFGARVSTRF